MAQNRFRRTAFFAVVLLAIGVAIAVALKPPQQVVDVGRVVRGPLRVTIDQEGETRAHDSFTISAPISGRLMRVELQEGDRVARDQIVARIDPLPLSQREHDEVLARVESAEASLGEANANESRAREDRQLAHDERERDEGLARGGVVSAEELEKARNADTTAEAELGAAHFRVNAAASELKVAKAGMIGLEPAAGKQPLVELRSPVSGRVLRIQEKSERVVSSGTPILVLGDPKGLEIVTDVLSTDAVKVQPGAQVLIEGWGGDHPIRARVRLVEPQGFTKVSALGVEEKRVNVISDFIDSPGPLGDGYRVEARIVIWSAENALKVPESAVFRQGQAWNAFVIAGGRAQRREIEIGHRSDTEEEVLRGLSEGDQVILHPANQLSDGVRVQTKPG